jgi:hypothetical protein
MTLNHKRIRQVLHAITMIVFVISVIYKVKDLYLYGGKPPEQSDEGDTDNDDKHSDDSDAQSASLRGSPSQVKSLDGRTSNERTR